MTLNNVSTVAANVGDHTPKQLAWRLTCSCPAQFFHRSSFGSGSSLNICPLLCHLVIPLWIYTHSGVCERSCGISEHLREEFIRFGVGGLEYRSVALIVYMINFVNFFMFGMIINKTHVSSFLILIGRNIYTLFRIWLQYEMSETIKKTCTKIVLLQILIY